MTGLSLRLEPRLDGLGPEWDPLFAAGAAGLQTSREWFAATVEAALPPGAEPSFVAVTWASGPVVLFPMLAGPHAWQSLTTPYTCLWQPLMQPGIPHPMMLEACRLVGRHCRRHAVTRLEAIDAAWPGLPTLLAGFRAAGLACRRFDHFVNWYASVDCGWQPYLDTRPGALRETIRRKTRALERDGNIRIDMAASPDEVGRAFPAYEAVYARSWKEPEPFPRFNREVALRLAQIGGLRMFVMWSADRPVAAQYWTVARGAATVLKLAHDEEEKRLSPGTVLTATAIRRLIETEDVCELDFGRGDDPYKQAWTGQRRQRIGVLGLDVATGQGLATMARHDLGRIARRLRSWRRG